MSMSASTLATELKNMGLYDNEHDAAAAWADAFSTYFEDAVAGPDPPGPTAGTIAVLALGPAKTAMQEVLQGPNPDPAVLDGMSTPNQAAAKIQEGIVAFWGALVPAIAWPILPPAGPCTLITAPSGLTGPTGIAIALTSTFLTNTNDKKSKDDALDAIANDIHSRNGTGGVATFPPTVGGGLGPLPIV